MVKSFASVSSEGVEKPGIEPMTPGLQVEWLNHYTTEVPLLCRVYFKLHFTQCDNLIQLGYGFLL